MKSSDSRCDPDGFVGEFRELLRRFVDMKRACGRVYATTADILRRFSEFSVKYAAESGDKRDKGDEDGEYGGDVFEAWRRKRPEEMDTTWEHRVDALKQFVVFLNDLGHVIRVPRCGRRIDRDASTPYVFTREELRRFFAECDAIGPHPRSNNDILLPTLFRTLYGCGMRISEAVNIELSDADLERGILVVRASKFDKDRLLPVSDSVLRCLREYVFATHPLPEAGVRFFVKKDRAPLNRSTIYKKFRMLLWRAGISHGGRTKGPRVHDLRHTFAVHSLDKMISEGRHAYNSLPALSAYLGHASVEATERYVRFTGEAYADMLEKSRLICGSVFPEFTE